jgi:hypothetical protein
MKRRIDRQAYLAGQAAADRFMDKIESRLTRIQELRAARDAILRAQKMARMENDDQVEWILDRCLEELDSAIQCSTPMDAAQRAANRKALIATRKAFRALKSKRKRA